MQKYVVERNILDALHLQICLSFPAVGDAKHYARLAFENYLICRGASSPCTLRLYGYMLNPEAHPASQTAKQYADAVRYSIAVRPLLRMT